MSEVVMSLCSVCCYIFVVSLFKCICLSNFNWVNRRKLILSFNISPRYELYSIKKENCDLALLRKSKCIKNYIAKCKRVKRLEKTKTSFSLATSAKIGYNSLARNLFFARYYRKLGVGMGRQNRIQPSVVS